MKCFDIIKHYEHFIDCNHNLADKMFGSQKKNEIYYYFIPIRIACAHDGNAAVMHVPQTIKKFEEKWFS